MSTGPDKVPMVTDLLNGSGATVTTTGAGPTCVFPAGKKAISVSVGVASTSVATVKVQNSVDASVWFDVTSSTSLQSQIWEVDSVVPYWRANVTSVTTAPTTASPLVAKIATIVP